MPKLASVGRRCCLSWRYVAFEGVEQVVSVETLSAIYFWMVPSVSSAMNAFDCSSSILLIGNKLGPSIGSLLLP